MEQMQIYDVNDIKSLYKEHIFGITKKYCNLKDLVKYVVNICESTELPFRIESECNVILPYETFKVIKDYYINLAKLLNGDTDLLDLNSTITLINEYFKDTILTTKSLRINDNNNRPIARNNWLELTKAMPPKTYYKTFFFSKECVLKYISSIINLKDMIDEINKEHNLAIGTKRFYKYLKRRPDIVETKITFLGRWTFYPRYVKDDFIKDILGKGTEIFTGAQLAEILGLDRMVVQKDIRANNIKAEKSITRVYEITKEEVERICCLKENTININYILENLIDKQGYSNKQLKSFIKDESYFNFKVLLSDQMYCLNPLLSFSVYREDLKQFLIALNSLIESKKYVKLDTNTKFDLKFSEEAKSNFFKTIEDFKSFYEVRKNKSYYKSFSVLDFLLNFFEQNLNGELINCTDDDISELLDLLNLTQSNKLSTTVFCEFLNHLKKHNKVAYSGDYINPNRPERSKNITPYSEEIFFRFALMLFNPNYYLHNNFLNKACEKRSCAGAWLFATLHYVCGWRASDMISSLPRVKLPVDYKTFFDLVQSKTFTEEMANEIVTEVGFKIQYKNIKPRKTKKKNPKKLTWEIPESSIYTVGMLIGLCEAHLLKNKDTGTYSDSKTLTTKYSLTKENQINFFGEEFIELFQEKAISNRKLNKSYLTYIAKNGEDEEIGSGYVLVSVARSHKFTDIEKSNTSYVYLQYYKNMPESEIIIRELFERGVCSFVPYLLLKTVYGDEKILGLPIEKQTQLLKESHMLDPYTGEIFVTTYENVYGKAEKEVEELIVNFKDDSLEYKEDIKRFVKKIAYGKAKGKDSCVDCMAIAKGLGCIHNKRDNCINCGEEIYLKSAFHYIGKKFRELINNAEKAETESSKNKYLMMSNSILQPLVAELIQVLKSIYKVEDVSSFKNIILGLEERVITDDMCNK